MRKIKSNLIAISILAIFSVAVYHELWGKYLYLVTAYCNCPICINAPEFRDGRFANGKKVHWGAVAADPNVPFGTAVELVPIWPTDFWKINRILKTQRNFWVEDRGGKIKNRHIDVFIPDSMGGHQTALRWGRQKIRIKLNGVLAE